MSVHRELNPQVFGTQAGVDKVTSRAEQAPAGAMAGEQRMVQDSATRSVPYPPLDVKALEHQVGTLKVAALQIDKKLDSLSAKLEDLARSTHVRFERFSQALTRFEELHGHTQKDNHAKLAQVMAKVNERKVSDHQIQEMVDRHNTIIRNFENRLLSLQRVVSEQEMALLNSQSTLEEARNEIARLKRL